MKDAMKQAEQQLEGIDKDDRTMITGIVSKLESIKSESTKMLESTDLQYREASDSAEHIKKLTQEMQNAVDLLN